MATSAQRSQRLNRGITRTVFRWIHIVFAIPILGYIYSPFDKLPDYAFIDAGFSLFPSWSFRVVDVERPSGASTDLDKTG